jgi:hypothetical protein
VIFKLTAIQGIISVVYITKLEALARRLYITAYSHDSETLR